jgi:hypothetical protein
MVGHGIQRGYGCAKGERHFSLFNVERWVYNNDELRRLGEFAPPNLTTVPVLASRQDFSEWLIDAAVQTLREVGSCASRNHYVKREGIVVHHHASKQNYKVLLENDDKPKSQVAA